MKSTSALCLCAMFVYWCDEEMKPGGARSCVIHVEDRSSRLPIHVSILFRTVAAMLVL